MATSSRHLATRDGSDAELTSFFQPIPHDSTLPSSNASGPVNWASHDRLRSGTVVIDRPVAALVFGAGAESARPDASSRVTATGAAIGSVVSFDDESVICEVSSGAGPMRVALPRCHFPEDVRFGLPIEISVETVQGIRRPVVRLRATEKRENDALTRELADLIDGE